MNKKELAEAVASQNRITRAEAEKALKSLTEIVTKELANGEKVVLPGLGTFEISERPERDGRNPRTGEMIKIAATKTVKFKPGKALKESINQ
jgi:DNA-binding protein HU-beta